MRFGSEMEVESVFDVEKEVGLPLLNITSAIGMKSAASRTFILATSASQTSMAFRMLRAVSTSLRWRVSSASTRAARLRRAALSTHESHIIEM